MSENDVIAEYVKERYPWMLDTTDFVAYKLKMQWKTMVDELKEYLKNYSDRLKDSVKELGGEDNE